MCQLSFINSNNEKINGYLSILALTINSESDHKDGFGFFSSAHKKPIVCNTEIANSTINQQFLKFNKNPVICHVRKASVKTTEKISGHNHPFINDNYVLAHNGTLTHTKLDLPPNLIDSQFFHQELLAEFYKNPENLFLDIFNKTMKNFTGKFAFLIYDISSKKYYAIRGMATLYIAYIKINGENIGYIINTEKGSIDKLIHYAETTIPLLFKVYPEFTSPELLKAETAFELKKDNIEEIGKVLEVATPYKQTVFYRNYEVPPNNGHYTKTTKNKITRPLTDDSSLNQIAEKFSDFLDYVGPLEIDTMFFLIYGKGILECTLDEINEFFDKYSKRILAYATKDKQKAFQKIYQAQTAPKEKILLYEGIGLKFPYFLHTTKDLQGIIPNAHKNPNSKEIISIGGTVAE